MAVRLRRHTDYHVADWSAVEALRRAWFAEVPAGPVYAASVVARSAFYRAWAAGDTRVGLDQCRVGALCDRYGRSDRTDEVVATYRAALLSETRPVAGAVDLIKYSAGSYRLGIITNAYDAEAQRARVSATGLDRWVEVVIVAVEVGYFKPDPRIMVAAVTRLVLLRGSVFTSPIPTSSTSLLPRRQGCTPSMSDTSFPSSTCRASQTCRTFTMPCATPSRLPDPDEPIDPSFAADASRMTIVVRST